MLKCFSELFVKKIDATKTIIEADKVEPLTNGDWHYGSEPMQNISYSDRTTIIEADKESKE